MKTACLILFAAWTAAAQPIQPSPAIDVESQTVSRLLASAEPARQAWGAYLAANYRLPGFTGQLLRMAVSADWRIRLAAVDALLRLNAAIPEDTLIQMAADRIDPVLVVLARKSGEYPRVVEHLLSRDLDDRRWVGLNSILAAHPARTHVWALLREWRINVRVTVSAKPWETYSGVVGGGLICSLGASYSQPGFPPLESYFVLENPGPGDRILTAGPHPVGYRRQPDASITSGGKIDRNRYRGDHLLHMAGVSTIGIAEQQPIPWVDEADFRARIAGIRQNAQAAVTRFKSLLVERNLLRADEASAIGPAIELNVVDLRERPATPLPDVSR